MYPYFAAMNGKKYDKFFKKLGQRCREIRIQKGWTQEDMLEHGFATRHYQRIEAGLAINMISALRLAKAFGIKLSDLVKGID